MRMLKNLEKQLVLLSILLMTMASCTDINNNKALSQEKLEELCIESYTHDLRVVNERKFDIELYDNIIPLNTPFGTNKVWNYTYNPCTDPDGLRPQYSLGQPYMSRMYRFEAGKWLGPDKMGELLLNNRIMYVTDFTGQNEVESAIIAKKYGLEYYPFAKGIFYPSNKESSPAFLKTDLRKYKDSLLNDFIKQRKDIKELETKTGIKILNQKEHLWHVPLVGGADQLGWFINCCRWDYKKLNTEFRNEMGFDLPLWVDLSKPENRAKRSKMWQWASGRIGTMYKVYTGTFREVVAGPDAVFMTHFHAGTVLDYERLAEAYDIPGIAIRPMLGSSELDYIYYTGYMTRLFADLTDKIPQVSVRVNIPWVGAHIIPSPDAIKYWHSQAVQNGTRLFFHWVWDYRSDEEVELRDKDWRGGLIVRTLDKSTLPELRFNTLLEISQKLGHANVFIPPKSKTGIFVSLDTNYIEREGWLRNLSSYIELTQAKIWVNFISDQELREGSETLDQFKVLYLPMIKFEHPEQVNDIIRFVENGGTIITSDPNIFAYDDWGHPTGHLRTDVFGVTGLKERSNQADNTITMTEEFNCVSITPYCNAYNIENTEDVKVIATYPDGKAAAVVKELGKGKAYFFGGNILDIYLMRNNYCESKLDFRRDLLYKNIENNNECPDLSWIWNINVDNVHKVTGEAEIEPVKIDESIVFNK